MNFAQLRLPEQRARLEKHAGRGQPFAKQDQHVDSSTSSGDFKKKKLWGCDRQKRATAIRQAFNRAVLAAS